jgi:C-terminal processing protease CtpA/Prc
MREAIFAVWNRRAEARAERVTRRAALLLGALGPLSPCLACAPERGTIGALLGQSADQRLVLREVPPELAAGRAGLRPGDELLLIDGRDVRELDERGVHRALGGNLGDSVKLTLLREGRVVRVTVRRTAPPAQDKPRKPG